MEWIETTAKTVDSAKEIALDRLGVDESEAEFEVVEEPKQGLFGRVRGEARVRARVTPKTPRTKDDRNDRRRRNKKGKGNGAGRERSSSKDGGSSQKSDFDGEGDGRNGGSSRSGSGQQGRKRDQQGGRNRNRNGGSAKKSSGNQRQEEASMDDVKQSVDKFLVGLVAAFDIDTTVSVEEDDGAIFAEIQGKHGLLLGPKARTLDAIQELTRVTAQRATPSSIRIKVDVGGYRQARQEALQDFAQQAAARALADQEDVVLDPMSSADRKVIHDALTDVDGVTTRSAGNDPRRRVVIEPTAPAVNPAAASAEDEAASNEAVSNEDTEGSSGDGEESPE